MKLRSSVQGAAMRATRCRATANLCADPEAVSLVSVSLASLHHLVLSGHHHGRSCDSPISLLSHLSFTETKNKIQFLWGCGANHQFYWDPLECSTVKCKEGCATLKEHSESTVQQLCDKEQKTLLCNTGILSNNLTMQENCNLIVEVSESLNTQNTCFKGSSQHTNVCGAIECHKNAEKDNPMPDLCWRPSETYHRKEDNSSTPAELTGEVRKQNISVESQQIGLLAENALDLTGKSDLIQDKASHAKEALATCLGGNLGVDGKQSNSVSSSKRKNKACSTGKHRNTCVSQGKTIPLAEKEKEQHTQGHKEHHGDHEIEFTAIEKSHYVETSRDICEILCDSLERDQKDEICAEVATMNNWSNEGQHGLNKHHLEDGKAQNQTSNRQKPFVDEELAEICKKRIRKSTQSELFLCEVNNCGKVFSKRQYLNYHQKYQHVNQRTFCCPVPECGRKFNFKKHLKEHEKRHSDRRDFICEFCARAFRSSSNLIIHHRIHTGEKPLQCEFCGFTCRQKASLNWHMKKHDADTFYQFPCNICGQRFEKRDNLAAHRSRKHHAPLESASVETTHSSAKVNEQENSSCCKTLTPENFPTNTGATADTTQGVKDSTFSQCQDQTDNTNEQLQENAQVSDHVQSEISLVIIL